MSEPLELKLLCRKLVHVVWGIFPQDLDWAGRETGNRSQRVMRRAIVGVHSNVLATVVQQTTRESPARGRCATESQSSSLGCSPCTHMPNLPTGIKKRDELGRGS